MRDQTDAGDTKKKNFCTLNIYAWMLNNMNNDFKHIQVLLKFFFYRMG